MDEGRFEALYLQLQRPIFTFAMTQLSADEAKDIVHDTFEVVWRKRAEAPEDPERWPGWCWGIAKKKILQEFDRRRRKHHDARFAEDYPSEAARNARASSDIADSVANAEVAKNVLASLNNGEREALSLIVSMDGSGAEVSQAMGVSYSAYTTRVARLRTKVRRALEAPEDGYREEVSRGEREQG